MGVLVVEKEQLPRPTVSQRRRVPTYSVDSVCQYLVGAFVFLQEGAKLLGSLRFGVVDGHMAGAEILWQ